MKWMCSAAAVVGLFLGLSCPSRLDAAPVASEILASYHFVGTRQWSDAPGSTKLREILALPQTDALGHYLVERIARSPRVLYPQALDDNQLAGGVPLLQGILAELLQHESFLEMRSNAGGAMQCLFGVAMETDRLRSWEKKLEELLALWKFDQRASADKDGVKVTSVTRGSNPTVVRWGQSGGWLVLAIGPESVQGWDEMLAGLRQSRRPRPALSEHWLSADLNLAGLANRLGLPGSTSWPRVALRASDREQDVRLVGRLEFAEPVTGPLDPWQVPTNIIREPLIGFSAWRGARPLLARWDVLSRLGIEPVPNEVYFWAQALSVPQSLFAFPARDPIPRVQAMLEPARALIPVRWSERGLGQIEWREAESQVIWKSLPLLVPHVRGIQEQDRGYIMGGTFPALHTTNGPPRELLEQLSAKSDLLYYHWELTARRLPQLRLQLQLGTMMNGKSILQTNSPAMAWLDEMERRLDNSATEMLAVSPREWSLTRRSPIGLTAAELLGLLCWAESIDFPLFTFRFPDHVGPKAPALPKKKR